ncbi:DUF485 domain-containing protein [Parasphingorhabdus pacifica]
MLETYRATSRTGVSPEPRASADRFGAITEGGLRPVEPAPDFVAIARSQEFTDLRHVFRTFVAKAGAAILICFVGYVIAAGWFPEFMRTPLLGTASIGLVLGLVQFAMPLLVTAAYAWFARTQLDPRASEVRRSAAEDARP